MKYGDAAPVDVIAPTELDVARSLSSLTRSKPQQNPMPPRQADGCFRARAQMLSSVVKLTAPSTGRRFLSSQACRQQQAAFETGSPAAPAQGRQPLRLILLGAPGAGKGTQTDSLLRKFHLRSLVVGNLLRDEVARKTEVGAQAAKVMKEGGLLDNETILRVVKPGLVQMNGQDWILVSSSLRGSLPGLHLQVVDQVVDQSYILRCTIL